MPVCIDVGQLSGDNAETSLQHLRSGVAVIVQKNGKPIGVIIPVHAWLAAEAYIGDVATRARVEGNSDVRYRLSGPDSEIDR